MACEEEDEGRGDDKEVLGYEFYGRRSRVINLATGLAVFEPGELLHSND